MSASLSISEICQSRLELWAKEMADCNATPILALSVGHGECSGELHLFAVENISNDELALFLAFCLREVERRAA
jgi:hypothetical protein